jgi:LacI family transcriptional regulator
MATLQEIADRCGVSVQTASAVLNTDRAKLFRPEVRRRIEGTAAEVGYEPNRAARVLRGARTRTIGVISHGVSSLTGLSLVDMIASLDQTLHARGYRALQAFCWGEGERMREDVKEMLGHRVEGMILLCPARYFLSGVPDLTLPEGLPVVSLESWPSVGADRVLVDRRGAMDRMMEEALRLGHRHFAFVCSTVATNREKYEAVRDAARRAGSELGPERVFEGATGKETGSPFTDQLLALRPRPTWVVCSNDFVAAGVIQGMRRRGVDVPGGVSVSGYDGLWCMQHFDPPLTTLATPWEAMGHRAAGMMLERIERPGMAARVERLVPELRLGESTGAAPVQITGDGHVKA